MLDRLLCWWHTGHDYRALGSAMLERGPYFVNQCQNCGKIKRTPWP